MIALWLLSIGTHVTRYGDAATCRFREGYLAVYWGGDPAERNEAVFNDCCSPYRHPDESHGGQIRELPPDRRWDTHAPTSLFNPSWWRAVPFTWAILGPQSYFKTLFQHQMGLWPPIVRLHAKERCFVLPIWLLVAATGIRWFVHLRRGRRALPGHCRLCGYDLTGNVTGRCPECGGAA